MTEHIDETADRIKAESPEIEPDDQATNPDPGVPDGVVEIPTDYDAEEA